MLTSLYYYQHYTPYIVKNAYSNGGSLKTARKKEIVLEDSNSKPEVTLNKSLSSEIVKYAKGIYRNTTDLKHTSRKLATDISNYSKYKNFEEFDQEVFEHGFKNDLEQFSDSYNKSLKFLKNQQHSKYLGETAEELETLVNNSQEVLSVMGLEKNEEGNLFVNGNENTLLNGKNFDVNTENARKLFSGVYEKTTGILNDPMAKHMNFKSLNYYYNYNVDKIRVDSFQIVKTGLLVNLAL